MIIVISTSFDFMTKRFLIPILHYAILFAYLRLIYIPQFLLSIIHLTLYSMPHCLCISSSLSPTSNSAHLITKITEKIIAKGGTAEILDLRNETVPFCDGRDFSEYPSKLHEIAQKIQQADIIIFGMAIYCSSVSGVLKNFIDIFSDALMHKPFGVCASAGSKMSYYGIGDLVKIMTFECKTNPIHPFVLCGKNDFDAQGVLQESIVNRLQQLTDAMITDYKK